MRYQKYQPAPHLAPFVVCYFVWEQIDRLAAPLRIESPPSGFASMVFSYGNAIRYVPKKAPPPPPPLS
jgi:hypothetical protein